MGKLLYGNGSPIALEDRLLAHLQVAVMAKLRRDERFSLSWVHEDGSGRSTIWIHPGIPLRFEFDGGRAPLLNRAWIEALVMSANSTGGLQLVPEPAAAPPARS
ncbi:hypothetical protein [Naasia aerilata]|uniref:DUF7882 domain-containing protein n=1 Tax=Naasia aerilata TaxID=1162966 RepID=A0ABM8GF41_9MICO|nr:hypothetical protein [Naasia aerilata]BDZ46925.1 hypothetical protein GCM10025866_28340 [Naasia aerilata]